MSDPFGDFYDKATEMSYTPEQWAWAQEKMRAETIEREHPPVI